MHMLFSFIKLFPIGCIELNGDHFERSLLYLTGVAITHPLCCRGYLDGVGND